MSRAHVVLVVDDNPETREAAADICSSLGYTTVCVASQAEALEVLEERRVCACLLDLEIPLKASSIPRVDIGWATLGRIQERYSRQELPVIVMTAHGTDHRHPARAALNEAAFLKKPFGLPGDDPADAVIKLVLQKSCEARFPQRCPNADAPARSTKKAGKKRARDARVYRGTVQLHLDGRLKNRLCRIEVDSQERWVRATTFEALYLLAVALRTTPTETLAGTTLGQHYNHAMSRAKADLEAKAGFDGSLIESDGHKGYRLSLPPDHVTCDEAAVRTHHPHLLLKAAWG